MKKNKDINIVNKFFTEYSIDKTDSNVIMYKNLMKNNQTLSVLIERKKEILGLINYLYQYNVNPKDLDLKENGKDIDLYISNTEDVITFQDISKKNMKSIISMISMMENKEGR